MPSLYLINPNCSKPQQYGAEIVGQLSGTRIAAIADLAIATVGAMARPYLDVRLADELIEPADLSLRPDFVALTGKVSQVPRLIELAQHYRSQGCTVLAGGPFASMSPEIVRPHVDVLVEGEMEEIGEQVFRELSQKQHQASYQGTRPDLSLSPLPAWDLYPNQHALVGTVQTSRGCPFECEFCDVIQYLGRKQRFKPIPLVIQELDQLYALGYRRVLLCDDNFTVNRARAKELLQALKDWNRRQTQGPVALMTQGSIDMARDDELLKLCSEAGLQRIFVGVETPHEGSLREAKKHQNVGIDLQERLLKIVEYGVAIEAGCIVGFDAEPENILELQREFWMQSAVPNILMSNLVALESTPLHQRMKNTGRLLANSSEASSPWWSNIQPLHRTREELENGLQNLSEQLYHPDAFAIRLERFARHFSQRVEPWKTTYRPGPLPVAIKAWLSCLGKLRNQGPLWKQVESLSRQYPQAASHLGASLVLFMQQRMLLRAL